jgi:hypothetical protein
LIERVGRADEALRPLVAGLAPYRSGLPDDAVVDLASVEVLVVPRFGMKELAVTDELRARLPTIASPCRLTTPESRSAGR